MTYRDLGKRLQDHPFQPFRIRTVNNTTYDILEPWMVTLGKSSAFIVTQFERDRDGIVIATDRRTVSIAL